LLKDNQRGGWRMVQLQQLIYFQEVVKMKSMNKAAEQLFTTQSNLSKSIKNLEKQLQITLFERNNKGVQLTEEGKKLLQYAKTVMRQLELIEHIAEEENKRYLSISAYPVVTMAYFVRKYYETNKEGSVEILLNEQRMDKVLSDVAEQISEIGIIQYNQVQEKEVYRRLKAKNLELCKLAQDTWYANIGPNNPLYEKDIVTMDELLQYPILRARDDYFSSLSYYVEIDGHQLTEFTKSIFINNGATLIKLLQDSEGVRFGPGLSKVDYEKFGIKSIPIKNCDVHITVAWIKRKNDNLTKEGQVFMDIVQQYFKHKDKEV
jgi:DNA-binding transcriptional LysR family regulator